MICVRVTKMEANNTHLVPPVCILHRISQIHQTAYSRRRRQMVAVRTNLQSFSIKCRLPPQPAGQTAAGQLAQAADLLVGRAAAPEVLQVLQAATGMSSSTDRSFIQVPQISSNPSSHLKIQDTQPKNQWRMLSTATSPQQV